jgi:hypothetical protein
MTKGGDSDRGEPHGVLLWIEVYKIAHCHSIGAWLDRALLGPALGHLHTRETRAPEGTTDQRQAALNALRCLHFACSSLLLEICDFASKRQGEPHRGRVDLLGCSKDLRRREVRGVAHGRIHTTAKLLARSVG